MLEISISSCLMIILKFFERHKADRRCQYEKVVDREISIEESRIEYENYDFEN